MKFPSVGGEGSQAGLFVRLKSGEKVLGVFRGEPKIFRQHWVGGRSSVCVGKDTCELCQAADKPAFRFRLNFLTRTDGIWMAKIFEQGYGVYQDLKALHEADYNLEETMVSITRVGEGKDTRYGIIPMRGNASMTPEHFQALAKIPLNDLTPGGKAEEKTPTPEHEPGWDDNIGL